MTLSKEEEFANKFAQEFSNIIEGLTNVDPEINNKSKIRLANFYDTWFDKVQSIVQHCSDIGDSPDSLDDNERLDRIIPIILMIREVMIKYEIMTSKRYAEFDMVFKPMDKMTEH
jgi:hypothetical protein